MPSTERFVDEDGNIRWLALMSVGFATLILGWVSGFIDFVQTLGSGLDIGLTGLSSWIGSLITSILGMPEKIVSGGLGRIGVWVPDINTVIYSDRVDYTEFVAGLAKSGYALYSEPAADWLSMFGPLAIFVAILWWAAIAFVMMWGLSQIYAKFWGDNG